MGAGRYGGFGHTKGSMFIPLDLQFFATKAIGLNGHVTENSISSHREFFFGKSVNKIEKVLQQRGYKTKRRPSIHSGSKAKIIITTNSSKIKNISQIQVSPGSKRHGNVPYVKISTTDGGKYKIINSTKAKYKTDGNEKAKLFFRRHHK